MLEIRHLKTLVALAETGNISKAAKQVKLSQPAVSHQIRAIETHYDVELFERKSDPLRLTAAGQRFIQLGRRWNLTWSRGFMPIRLVSSEKAARIS